MKLAAAVPPMPEELLDGLLGVTAAVNGCANIGQLIAGLRSQLEPTAQPTTSDVVAAAFGSTPDDIECRHTTIPVRHPFTEARQAQDGIWLRVIRGRVLERAETGARTCPACVQDDLRLSRRSHWRRAHQIPTIDWCPIHGDPLFRSGINAFARRPSDALLRGDGEALHHVEDWHRYPMLVCYTELLAHWLRQDQPLSCTALAIVVQAGLHLRGFRAQRPGDCSVIDAELRQQLPFEWLKRYWPELASMQSSALATQLAGICQSRSVAYAGPASALVLVALFDSADEIVSRLKAAQQLVDQEASAAEALWLSGRIRPNGTSNIDDHRRSGQWHPSREPATPFEALRLSAASHEGA